MALSEEEKKQFEDAYLTHAQCPQCNSADHVVRIITGRPSTDLIH